MRRPSVWDHPDNSIPQHPDGLGYYGKPSHNFSNPPEGVDKIISTDYAGVAIFISLCVVAISVWLARVVLRPKCNQCGMRARKYKYCVRCKNAFYCSRAHQKQDWTRHKLTCRPCAEGWSVSTAVGKVARRGWRWAKRSEFVGWACIVVVVLAVCVVLAKEPALGDLTERRAFHVPRSWCNPTYNDQFPPHVATRLPPDSIWRRRAPRMLCTDSTFDAPREDITCDPFILQSYCTGQMAQSISPGWTYTYQRDERTGQSIKEQVLRCWADKKLALLDWERLKVVGKWSAHFAKRRYGLVFRGGSLNTPDGCMLVEGGAILPPRRAKEEKDNTQN